MIKTSHRLLFTILALLVSVTSRAFEWLDDGRYPGRHSDNPIVHVIPDGDFEICDTIDTYMWSLHKFYPETIHYDIELAEPKMMTICTYGSEVKNISVRVSSVSSSGDTVPVSVSQELKDTYINQLRAVNAWNVADCFDTQEFFVALNASPGKYRVEVQGIYTQKSGTANGMICTSFTGSNIRPRPTLPKTFDT